MGLLLPTEAMSIVDRVQQGDPVAGWRGDPTADVYVGNGYAQAWLFDRAGKRYCAAQVSTLGQGWQHELLRRLRDGDYQHPDTIKNIVNKANAAHERAIAARQAERVGAAAEKVAWVMRRTLGTHFGGLTKDFY